LVHIQVFLDAIMGQLHMSWHVFLAMNLSHSEHLHLYLHGLTLDANFPQSPHLALHEHFLQ